MTGIDKPSIRLTLVIGIVLIAAVLAWRWDAAERLLPSVTGNVPSENPASSPAIKVITHSAVYTSNDRIFEAVGTGRARLSIQLYPAVSEEVTEILFEAQDSVAKGQRLVQMDDRQERLAVRLAEVRLKDARSLLNRYEQAVQQGGVPQSEVDAAMADFEAARIALDQAQLDLSERRIRAPFSGVVGIANVDPGDRVSPDTLITTLDDRRILYVDYEVPEALASNLLHSSNQAVTVTTPAYPGETFDATITALGSRVDPGRRTLPVRASIDNSEDRLRPGMSFTIRWAIPGRDFPTVPEIALQWGREGAFVWLIRDGHAEREPVQVVARTAGQILLEGNIDEGEDVVVEGLLRLRPGAPVEILGRR